MFETAVILAISIKKLVVILQCAPRLLLCQERINGNWPDVKTCDKGRERRSEHDEGGYIVKDKKTMDILKMNESTGLKLSQMIIF